MRITLLGTGGPRPDPQRQGPATLVQVNGLNLVFDAGRGVATQLAKAEVDVTDIDALFITHHHFDHIGGLGDLLMAAWNNGRTDKLPVYGPIGTAEIVRTLLEDVYGRDVNYRLIEEQALGVTIDSPSSMVAVHEHMAGQIILETESETVHVTVGEVEHGTTALDLPVEDWATVGYRVSVGGRNVTISGDAVAGRDLAMLAANADVLVMCAYLAAAEINSEASRFLVENVIAGAPQAAAIAEATHVRRLVLTHIREKPDAAIEQMRADVATIFGGEVLIGHDLMRLEV